MADHIVQLILLFHCDGESVHCPSQVHFAVLDMETLAEAVHQHNSKHSTMTRKIMVREGEQDTPDHLEDA
jgi:hypothetical protein